MKKIVGFSNVLGACLWRRDVRVSFFEINFKNLVRVGAN